MAAAVSKASARFHKLTRREQKEILLRHVDQINLTYALPASLSGAPGMLLGDGNATELGKAVADEWARNVMGFIQGEKPRWQLEIVM